MALPKLLSVFSEGSLLRRTLFHVGTLVVGTIAFITVASFVLVSVAKGILPDAAGSGASAHEVAASSDDDQAAAPAAAAGAKTRFGSAMRHSKKRLGMPGHAE